METSRGRRPLPRAPSRVYDALRGHSQFSPVVQSEAAGVHSGEAYKQAEPIRQDTLERFTSAFAGSGFQPGAFRPCYGLAEATLLVTCGRFDAAASRPATGVGAGGGECSVSCGRPGFGTSVIVVDPKSHRPCADGAVGEVWVNGPGVAAGYWNWPSQSAGTFAARTADGRGPYLRTGDLGVIGDDGVRITGRLKDVLVVRGTKHYPQDIERTAESRHLAVRPGCVAAFVADHGSSGDRIALVAEVDPHGLASSADAQAAISAIRSGVTDAHGIQLSAVTLVAPGGVEKTTSGKVKRFACRDALLAGTLKTLATWRQTPPRDARAANGTPSPAGPAVRGRQQEAACP